MARKKKRFSFDAVIEEGRRGGAHVQFPHDVRGLFGTGRPVRVQAWFDGVPHKGALNPAGGGTHVLGMRKAIREELGKKIGDTVRVDVEEDVSAPKVILPDELEAALRNDRVAREAFEAIPPSHQKRYADWVDEARKPETRRRRAAESVERLKRD